MRTGVSMISQSLPASEIKAALLSAGWPERVDPSSHPTKAAIWSAILTRSGVRASWKNGPWVAAGLCKSHFHITGESHLPAIAAALEAEGIAFTHELGMIEVPARG